MAGIHYRLYEDRDAEQVLELFRRNRFYIGKRPADAEDFRYAWKARGGLFAVIGEADDGRVIAYLAVYPTGDRIVCRPHQVVLGGLLVDRDYRLSLYSMPQMYALVLKEISRFPEITTLISEVDDYRRQSMLIQRYTGAVMLNGAVPVEEKVYSFYNFLPGLSRLFDPASATLKIPRMSMLTPPDKRRACEPDPVRDGQFVELKYHLPYGETRFSCHIPSGLMNRMEVENRWIWELDNDSRTLFIHLSPSEEAASVAFFGKNGEIGREAVKGPGDWHGTLPEGTEKAHIRIAGVHDSYWLEPAAMRRATLEERPVYRIEDTVFDPNTGMLTVHGLFSEVWPAMDMPYRIGTLYPEHRPDLVTEQDGTRLTARCGCQRGEVIRRYTIGRDEIRIHTRFRMSETDEIHPLFQMYIHEHQMSCFFPAYDEGRQEIPVDFERDLKKASPEIPFVLLGPRKQDFKPVSDFLMRFEEETYHVRFSRPTLAYLQFDYLAMEPEAQADDSGAVDFGEIVITRVTE